MKKIFSVILCFTLSTSCKHKCSMYDAMFTNCRVKYWDFHKQGQGRIGAFRLDIDGSCYYLFNDRELKKRVFFYSSHIVQGQNIWKKYNDNIVLGSAYEIYKLRLLTDTFMIISKENEDIHEIDTLVISSDQKDIYNFDSLKNCVNTPYYFDFKKIQH